MTQTDHAQIIAALWTAWTGSSADGLQRVAIAADRGVTGHVERCTRGSLEAVVKIPGAQADPAWAAREAFTLQHVLNPLDILVPELLAQLPTERGPALLLSVCPGVDGDIAAEPDLDLARRVLAALEPLHAMQPEAQWMSHLPQWGAGTAGAARPHARRVRRFERRYKACLQAWGRPEDLPWLHTLAERMLPTLEDDCARLVGLDTRVLHGDLHADNLRLDGRRVYVLDWQSTSRGAPLIDTAYWLNVQMSHETASACNDLGRAHLEAVGAWPGAPYWQAAQRVGLSGTISAYATRLPSMVCHREAAFVRRQLSSDGLSGVLAMSMRR